MISIKPTQIIHPQQPTNQLNKNDASIIQIEEFQTVSTWSNDVQDLEQYFNSVEIPIGPVQLNQHMNILSLSKFIECNLNNLKTYNGNSYFIPHLERLQTIKQYLEHEQ